MSSNPEDVPNGPRTGAPEPIEPRRRDRARDPEWIRAFLTRAPVGVLVTVAQGRAFPNPNLFLFDGDGDWLYVHTARTGRTPSNARAEGPASFVAWAMGRFIPASEALEFGVEYAAVVAFGELATVGEVHEKRRVMEGIMAKYAAHLEPGRDYRPITEGELARTSVHRMEIREWSGKELLADAASPGAYALPPITLPFEV